MVHLSHPYMTTGERVFLLTFWENPNFKILYKSFHDTALGTTLYGFSPFSFCTCYSHFSDPFQFLLLLTFQDFSLRNLSLCLWVVPQPCVPRALQVSSSIALVIPYFSCLLPCLLSSRIQRLGPTGLVWGYVAEFHHCRFSIFQGHGMWWECKAGHLSQTLEVRRSGLEDVTSEDNLPFVHEWKVKCFPGKECVCRGSGEKEDTMFEA